MTIPRRGEGVIEGKVFLQNEWGTNGGLIGFLCVILRLGAGDSGPKAVRFGETKRENRAKQMMLAEGEPLGGPFGKRWVAGMMHEGRVADGGA